MNSATADKIASSLNLSFNEKEYFDLLIIASSGRTVTACEAAKKKLDSIREKKKYTIAKTGFDGILSCWYYIPLIELLALCNGRSNQAIAHILGITTDEVTRAIAQLEMSGYIRPTARGWAKSMPFLQIESPNHEMAIKKYHKNLIEIGARALKQPIRKRKFLSSVLGIRKSSIEQARRDIEQFSSDFMAKYATQNSADTVYAMNVQFFEFENMENL
jgi:uncharacterized protein (TIGR02147 family)